MTTTTLTYSGNLVATSCWCGIGVAIPKSLYQAAQQDHNQSVYCPLGHSFVFGGDTEAQRLKRELEWERDRVAGLIADRDQTAASLRATKGVVTKMRRRAIAGACQFCHRHFVNVERHMATQHPTEAGDPETDVAS